jgi:hypothetical protein
MADKSSIGGLNDAVETLNNDNSKLGIESSEHLGNIDAGIKDLFSVNSQMLEVMSAVQESLAPDAFGSAQSTEQTREGTAGDGPPIIGGPAGASSVEGSKDGGGFGMLALAAAAGVGALIGAFAGLLDFDANSIKEKVKTLVSIADEVDGVDTAETVATLLALGGALAIFGGGSAIAAVGDGLGKAIDNFTNATWSQSIVDSVVTLVGMADKINGFDTVETVATLTTLGGALAIFGGGSAIASVGDGLGNAITKLTDASWAQSIVDNAVTLVGMADKINGFDTVETVATLTALGAGLAIFGGGSAIAAVGDGLGKAMDHFTDASWAKSIVANVTELMKISELSMWDAAKFPVLMGLIASGLVLFAVGETAGAMSGALTSFANPDFAKNIVTNVTTLMSISQLPMLDVAKFPIIMTALGAGLIAFSAGQGAATAVALFETEGWTTKIKTNVKELLSITSEEGINEEKATEFSTVMGKLSAGLLKFSAGKLADSLAGAGAGILNFISGNESPVSQMMKIANKSDQLTKGADALDRIRGALSGLSALKFDGSDLNITDMAEDLVKAVPVLEKAIMGGKITGGWFGDDVEFKGLASADINYDDAIKNIGALRVALGAPSSPTTSASGLTPSAPMSGQALQSAQGEMTTLERMANNAGQVAVQQNIAPNTVNNAATTNIATRNQHHKVQNHELLLGVY